MRKPGPNAPRWVHRLYAFTHGYYWVPCPMCGKHFGGHEEHGSLFYGLARGGESVCRNCAARAEEANQPRYAAMRSAPVYIGVDGRTYYDEATFLRTSLRYEMTRPLPGCPHATTYVLNSTCPQRDQHTGICSGPCMTTVRK